MSNPVRSSRYFEAAGSAPTNKRDLLPVRICKILWISFWLGFNTLVVAGPIALSTLFTSTGNIAFNLTRLWAWVLLKVTRVCLLVTGKQYLQAGQSYIVVANHSSHYDGPSLAQGLGIQFRWIAKKELLKIPLFGNCLHASGNIFIDRSNREKAIESINVGVKKIPRGVSVMCFAEGTRSDTGRLGTFKKGGFMAAIEHGLPILPVSVVGSSLVLPKGSLVFTPGTIVVAIGEPIDTGIYSMETVDVLMARTRDAILSGIENGC